MPDFQIQPSNESDFDPSAVKTKNLNSPHLRMGVNDYSGFGESSKAGARTLGKYLRF